MATGHRRIVCRQSPGFEIGTEGGRPDASRRRLDTANDGVRFAGVGSPPVWDRGGARIGASIMSTDTSIERHGTSPRTADAQGPGRTGHARTPLYIVCSPRRSVGKTLLSRMVAEFLLINDRPVAAFDLGEEEPQLVDYLPACTTLEEIGDTQGQMAFFDRLLADSGATKVIDLSHEAFGDFFVLVQQIGFFEEARRNGIEAIMLFLIDPNPKTAKAYGILQRWFTGGSLLPIRNPFVSRHVGENFHNKTGIPVAAEIPVLSPALQRVVDQCSFSFTEFWRATPGMLPERLDDELRAWMKRVFLQIREIELCVTRREIISGLAP